MLQSRQTHQMVGDHAIKERWMIEIKMILYFFFILKIHNLGHNGENSLHDDRT